jgi:hypothetical protein
MDSSGAIASRISHGLFMAGLLWQTFVTYFMLLM